ncbi:MAG: DUF1097 domain-containing protein [Desulfovibrionaceae bacterium]|nr:DUF1097 domain-containing protein [Desulfovibrionaceae bacterium]
MKYHLILGVICAIFAGVFGQFAADWGMLAWIGFASWACFFAAGGGVKGAQKTFLTNLYGMFIGWLVVYAASITGMHNPMLLPLMGGVFLLCAAGGISQLSFVPGAFIGCAAFLGSGALILETFISLLVGLVLGFISERIAQTIFAKITPASAQ